MLSRADVSQADCARLAGITARQVKQLGARPRRNAALALFLAIVFQERSPEALAVVLEEALPPAPAANRSPERARGCQGARHDEARTATGTAAPSTQDGRTQCLFLRLPGR